MFFQTRKRHKGNLMHIAKWKKPIWKLHTLFDSNYTMCWKRKYREESRKCLSVVVRSDRERWIHRAQSIFKAVDILCTMLRWCIYVIIQFPKPTECTKPRMTPHVNYESWMIKMCQWKLINCNKCMTLLGDVDNGRGCACVWGKGIWEIFTVSARFLWTWKCCLKKQTNPTIVKIQK